MKVELDPMSRKKLQENGFQFDTRKTSGIPDGKSSLAVEQIDEGGGKFFFTEELQNEAQQAPVEFL